ncbi:homeobox hemidesmosome 1, partial [Tanacetum coccineum]
SKTLIEQCLQLYMNKDEVMKTLLNRARMDPGFTVLGMSTEDDGGGEALDRIYECLDVMDASTAKF